MADGEQVKRSEAGAMGSEAQAVGRAASQLAVVRSSYKTYIFVSCGSLVSQPKPGYTAFGGNARKAR